MKGERMEMIAPLAKVLAEANGIDWRKIQGTGQGGQVVEEDILNYLTRVMEGDEEPPATPVDPPPPDWDGDMNQLPDMAALAAAGVDSDIANYVATARNESADLASDVMDFELELDDDDTEVAASHEEPITPLDDEPSAPPVVEPPAAPPAASAGIAGGLLSSLYRKPEVQASAPAQPEPEPQPEPIAASAPAPVSQPQAALAEPEVVEQDVVEPEVVEVAPAASMPVAPPVAEPQVVEPTPVPVAPVVTPPVATPVFQPVVVTSQPAPAYTPAVAAPISGNFVTLRRSFGAYSLVQAGEQLGEHFGGASAPLAVFVARAAARALGTLGLSSVGVYSVGDELTALATPNLTGHFRDAVADLGRAQSGTSSDLMVVDAGELGLDEITVASGVTLSFGEDVLTLSGAVSVKRGAAFLREVAELLESPIRLML
ncbi:E3 binding domain-containing protein [Deinococcus yavapaiensis]|uniref:E3 binding domain-containing protein n=1 Tax=Deinococcus yavapaiensis KR-236 TaxID=694435 RepID=A0A318S602_9DEIO|nr:E3 binding domain-containing protein [Deinococcus yavapaiensis]PYE54212.1 e3 binding domain-containing protein [Deinococcus yavapaiensis KR-236]